MSLVEGIVDQPFRVHYGFSSIFFLAETHYNIPLYDPEEIIKKLKKDVEEYPQQLKQSVIQQSLWAAEFTIWQAESFAGKADVYNTVGCLTRRVKNMMTALFALNEIYPMGDKRAVAILERSGTKPTQLSEKIDDVLCAGRDALPNSGTRLRSLFGETVKLAQGKYKPFYNYEKESL